MEANDSETEALLRDAAAGDERALRRLLDRYRDRVRRMVAVRLDPRLAARVDPSDIVQEALADVARKLRDYLRDQPIPFYPWLHRLAAERLAQAHRRHLHAQARSVGREQAGHAGLPDETARHLVEHLVASDTSPSRHLMREERRQRLRQALGRLSPADREVLVLCYIEGLAFGEIAAVLGITTNAAKVRHFRALERIRKLMPPDDGEIT